jgi:hypothetical protein
MTPLDRAKEIIDLRARATQGVWNERYVASAYSMHESNAEFTAHAANHAAEVAQALIDSEKRVAELVEIIEDANGVAFPFAEMQEKLTRIMGKETQDDA